MTHVQKLMWFETVLKLLQKQEFEYLFFSQNVSSKLVKAYVKYIIVE